jgi:hypothetical protein
MTLRLRKRGTQTIYGASIYTRDTITVETDRFEHRKVKPHFINPCCFGEDFAAWLKQELAPLAAHGFDFSEPIQEDYGWGMWASHGRDPFWIALSYVGDGPQEQPAQCVVSVSYDPGLNLMKRMFHRHSVDRFLPATRLASQMGISSRETTNHHA